MIYRIYTTVGFNPQQGAYTVDAVPSVSFIFDPANTAYQQFKQAINYDTAQLEDADGNVMDSATAIAFIKELP